MLISVSHAFILAGCSSTPPDIQLPPPAPTATLALVGAKEDKLDGRTAAAVQIAHDHADSPSIVRSETSVALAGLPKPNQGDLAYALARALKADPAIYLSDIAWSRKSLSEIDKLWAGMEAERLSNLSAMSKLKTEIDTLRKQVDEAKRDTWTLLGAALALIGALSLAFASKPAGAVLILSGFACGSFALLLGSPWFVPAVGVIAVVSIALGWIHYFRKHTHADHEQTNRQDP